MSTDHTPGATPVPIGTIVEYKYGGQWEITDHLDPEKHPYRRNLPADLSGDYPDGAAYVLWPVGLEKKFGNRNCSVAWVRRTSFQVVEIKGKGL